MYKLKEMDEKLGLFKGDNLKVLDLGAAPGSWSLYILRKLKNVSLVSVDLNPLSRNCDEGLFDGGNFSFIQGDFTLQEIREAVISTGPYNILISDAAPNTAGNRTLDSLRSIDLAEIALDFANSTLIKGGKLVIKIFQGPGSDLFIQTMRTSFENVKTMKPKACRPGSFEVYCIGLGKK